MTVSGTLNQRRVRPPEKCALLVVDIQERLMPAMAATQQPILAKACSVLLALAEHAQWPVIVSEQYPRGLGATVSELAAEFPAGTAAPIAKTTFSAVRTAAVSDALEAAAVEAVVVCGMEAHVCVLETVLDLLDRGVCVLVPWDGVASRREEDRRTALELMRAAGATVTSSETLVFQVLGDAAAGGFKTLSRKLR